MHLFTFTRMREILLFKYKHFLSPFRLWLRVCQFIYNCECKCSREKPHRENKSPFARLQIHFHITSLSLYSSPQLPKEHTYFEFALHIVSWSSSMGQGKLPAPTPPPHYSSHFFYLITHTINKRWLKWVPAHQTRCKWTRKGNSNKFTLTPRSHVCARFVHEWMNGWL